MMKGRLNQMASISHPSKLFKQTQRKVSKALAALGLVLVMLVTLVPGVTYAATVRTLTTCTETGLRQIVAQAADGDTIQFSCNGTITLTGGNTNYIQISKNLTLEGGSQQVTIDGGRNTALFFVYGGRTVNFNHLTLANGAAYNSGGAIFAQTGSNVSINMVNFSGNSGYVGGAIYNQQATISINGSSFSGNSVIQRGGAIYNETGTLNVSNSTFTTNSTPSSYQGGAIYSDGGSLKVSSSTFTSNYAGVGGAIDNRSTADIRYSTFSGNKSAHGGGAIFTESPMTIANSTFSANTAGGGGAIDNRDKLDIVNSTFVGNTAPSEISSAGAISNSGTLTLTNSTLSGNSAGYIAGGIRNGMGTDYHGTVTLINTIMANGAGGNCLGDIIDGGYNLENGNSCGLSAANHSLVDTDPGFDPNGLKLNGGSTQTLALQPSSPAVATANLTVCQSALVGGIDQRGLPRSTSYCDMGAYDTSSVAPVILVPTTTFLSVAPNSVAKGKTVVMSAVVTKSQGQNTPPTGKVVFKEGTTIVAEATVNSNGVAVATYTATGKSLVTHYLQAQYYGDNTCAPSTSNQASLLVL